MITACLNKKAEIVEALKVAKSNVKNGESRIDAVNGIREHELVMIKSGIKYDPPNEDSLELNAKMGMD